MTPPFPPQLFILIGIDVLLGGSVVMVVFDEKFPAGLPYVLDFAALVGFIQLILVGQVTGYPLEAQFYYSIAYALVAVGAVLGSNLFVVFVRRERMVGGVFAFAVAVPSVLSMASFISAYLNGEVVSLPTIPLLPWPAIWGAFLGASAIIAAATAMVAHRAKRQDGSIRG